jgi:hypothetical protein
MVRLWSASEAGLGVFGQGTYPGSLGRRGTPTRALKRGLGHSWSRSIGAVLQDNPDETATYTSAIPKQLTVPPPRHIASRRPLYS